MDESAAMGGVEFSTLYLAQRLDRELFSPVVVCPREGDLPRLCRESRVDTRVVPRGRLFSVTLRLGKRQLPNPLAALLDVLVLLVGAVRLRRFLQRERVDLVCTKGLLGHLQGGLAARLAGIPCVWHLQDSVSDRAWGVYRRLVGAFAGMLADHVVADGTPIVDQMPNPLRAAGRVSLVHNGVDTEEFSPQIDGQRVRREFGLEDDCLLVGNVARLTPWKGQEYLLQAAVHLVPPFPKAHFLLVGSPLFDSVAYERELRSMLVRLALEGKVTFAGYRTDLPYLLAGMDVFVYTSVEKDTSPLALLSAMAAGKAIVASDIAGVRELFRDGMDALLVPPADARSLAAALRDLLADGELRARLGRHARERALGQHSIERFCHSCEAVFLSVLEKRDKDLT